MQSYSESKSILTFKLHRVIIPILNRNVKFLIHFFSFYFSYLAVLVEPFGSLGWRLGGAGGKNLGEFWVWGNFGKIFVSG